MVVLLSQCKPKRGSSSRGEEPAAFSLPGEGGKGRSAPSPGTLQDSPQNLPQLRQGVGFSLLAGLGPSLSGQRWEKIHPGTCLLWRLGQAGHVMVGCVSQLPAA